MATATKKPARKTRKKSTKKKSRVDAFQEVTDRVLAALAEGTAPWQKPWSAKGINPKIPVSLSTGKKYQGINVMLLAMAGYQSRYWGTYKQIKERGGQVRKGETGTMIVFWRFFVKNQTDPVTGEERTDKFPMLRTFTVFNAQQADWGDDAKLPENWEDKPPKKKVRKVEIIEAAEAVADNYFAMDGAPSLGYGGDRAYYVPATDSIKLPERTDFHSDDEFYSTLFHEAAHSTGHKSRLNRKGIEEFDGFGSHKYSEEELVAEFAATMLAAETGITRTFDNSAAYIKGWAAKLSQPENKKLIVHAAGRAAKAASFILDAGAEDDTDGE